MENVNLKQLLADQGMRLIDLARALNVDKSVVTRWHYNRIPAERVVSVEGATGIARAELRPDLYEVVND